MMVQPIGRRALALQGPCPRDRERYFFGLRPGSSTTNGQADSVVAREVLFLMTVIFMMRYSNGATGSR